MKITDLAAQRAFDRLAKKGFEGLTDADKTLAATWLIDAGVTNNGFARFFASKRSDLAFHAPVALRKLGAMKLAEISEEANRLFGPKGPPADYRERRALVRTFDGVKRRKLERLDEQYLAASEVEDIDERLEAFLEMGANEPGAGRKTRRTK